jgi:proline iminopeptidase
MVETQSRQVRGVELFERRIGEGPPTIVLHGGPGAHHDYLLPGFDALAGGRTLIYYDQRGGGRSPVPRDVPVGWEEQVEDLEALRGLWGLKQLSIAGYFAQRNLDPALQEQRKQLRESGLRERAPEAYRQRVFELSVIAYFCNPAKVRDMTPFRVTGRTMEEVWTSLGDYDLRPGLARLSVPAIVLHGDCDPIPAETARAAADLLKAPFHLIPDCGHVPYVEAPEQFAELLDGFLKP